MLMLTLMPRRILDILWCTPGQVMFPLIYSAIVSEYERMWTPASAQKSQPSYHWGSPSSQYWSVHSSPFADHSEGHVATPASSCHFSIRGRRPCGLVTRAVVGQLWANAVPRRARRIRCCCYSTEYRPRGCLGRIAGTVGEALSDLCAA